MLRRRMVAIHRVGRRLNLNSDQVSQLKSFRAQTVDKIKGIRADSSLTTEQKKAQAREALQTARTEMRGVLTEDQKARASKMLQRLRRRRRGAV